MVRSIKKVRNYKIIWVLLRIAIMIAIILLFIYIQNNLAISSNKLYVNSKIPKQFVGYKICQITDLNNTVLNTEQTVDQLKPDIVIINGNISNTDGKYDSSVRLINKLAEKYRVLYTLG